jgi:hypothetical protein
VEGEQAGFEGRVRRDHLVHVFNWLRRQSILVAADSCEFTRTAKT